MANPFAFDSVLLSDKFQGGAWAWEGVVIQGRVGSVIKVPIYVKVDVLELKRL